jgi:hypothetical protein
MVTGAVPFKGPVAGAIDVTASGAFVVLKTAWGFFDGLMVRLTGLAVPVASPCHPRKVQPGFACTDRFSVVPEL